ncbi:hypothetical protein MNB_SUP05-SYMBIONT-4-504 [hydrothermal vent metagenome]|uniref:Uncharacterized protein n=1 Tax=hydrothermal vent metagenome TaxID=652676 RepID=A0A1W1DVQ3_9ZZZZ
MKTSGDEFKPYAYYNKHLDKIVFYGKDCSIVAERKNKVFTLLRDAHGKEEYMGFAIKGVRHMMKEVGFSNKESLTLAAFFTNIIETYNDDTMRMIQKQFSGSMKLTIENFDIAA